MNSEILNWGMNNMDENTIICRCEDLTLKEVRELIHEGYTTLEEIKRVSRAGMGPCQGITCGNLIIREINSITGKKIPEINATVSRPPVKGILIKEIVAGGREND